MKASKLLLLFLVLPIILSACSEGKDEPNNPTRKTIDINGHEAVDLGLSVMWSTCNFGASEESEVGYKFIFTHPSFTTDCKFYNPYLDTDIVTESWGNSWRIPTQEEVDELIDKCLFEVVFFNNEKYAKITSSNGNFIYLPYYRTSFGIDTYFLSSTIVDWNADVKALRGFAVDERRITQSWHELKNLGNTTDDFDLSPSFIRPVAK